eukprot:GHVL01018388.1.p1 GENE.GHVL01018388.1~~GHVL01018388.1.p1  ORF type:complete len:403 (+),score=72.99 GHVL01018388.1:86-1210(+)
MGWQKRYFYVHRGQLCYAHSPTENIKAVYDLHELHTAQTGDGKTFELCKRGTNITLLFLRTIGNNEIHLWTEALLAAIKCGAAGPQKRPTEDSTTPSNRHAITALGSNSSDDQQEEDDLNEVQVRLSDKVISAKQSFMNLKGEITKLAENIKNEELTELTKKLEKCQIAWDQAVTSLLRHADQKAELKDAKVRHLQNTLESFAKEQYRFERATNGRQGGVRSRKQTVVCSASPGDDEFHDVQSEEDEDPYQASASDLVVTRRKEEPLEDLATALSKVGTKHNQGGFVRRTRLPQARTKVKNSLWSVLKDMIGKDLSRISMPVYFNEPTSFLQRFAEDLQYTNILSEAIKHENPIDRLVWVAVFSLTPFAASNVS